MRKLFFFVFLLSLNLKISAQNKQVLYNFAELPQTLLLNPGSETNYNLHLGIPILSAFSLEFGSSGFTLSDLFANDGLKFNDKVDNILNRLKTNDFVKVYSQVEILSGGFRIDDKTYVSFGFYEELDAVGYYPKDISALLREGNASNINKSFSFSQLLYKIDLLGALHFGISNKLNDRLTLGTRVKLYSSALNLRSKNNTGTFVTVQGSNNIYKHFLSNINLTLNSSGLIKNEEFVEDVQTHFRNTFFSGNIGIGVDFGMTYHISDNLEFSGSIIDFGFINYNKNINNTTAKGSFNYEGVELDFNTVKNLSYWNTLDFNIKRNLVIDVNEDSYIGWRPIKINAAFRRSFGKKINRRIDRFFNKDFYTDSAGIQLYSVFRYFGPQLALTGFYQKTFNHVLNAKITYTIDNFSFYNVGLGVAAKFGKLSVYSTVDNILGFRNLSNTNILSLQIGLNLTFN